MPRPLRLHVPGAFYRVTLPANHRQSTIYSTVSRLRYSHISRRDFTRTAEAQSMDWRGLTCTLILLLCMRYLRVPGIDRHRSSQ